MEHAGVDKGESGLGFPCQLRYTVVELLQLYYFVLNRGLMTVMYIFCEGEVGVIRRNSLGSPLLPSKLV